MMRPTREQLAQVAARKGGKDQLRTLRDRWLKSRGQCADQLRLGKATVANLEAVIADADAVLVDVAAILGEVAA